MWSERQYFPDVAGCNSAESVQSPSGIIAAHGLISPINKANKTPLHNALLKSPMRIFFFITFICCAFVSIASHAQEPLPRDAIDNNLTVVVKYMSDDGKSYFEMQASGSVRATPQQAWKVLTDYGRQHEFVPNLQSTRLISRNAQEAIIEQKGTRRFLFLTQRINLIVRAVEQPFSSIDVSLISGDMKQYATRWELTPLGPNGNGGTRITYQGKMEPDFFVPPLFGSSMVQTDIRNMVLATLIEIDKINDKIGNNKPDGPDAPAAELKK